MKTLDHVMYKMVLLVTYPKTYESSSKNELSVFCVESMLILDMYKDCVLFYEILLWIYNYFW